MPPLLKKIRNLLDKKVFNEFDEETSKRESYSWHLSESDGWTHFAFRQAIKNIYWRRLGNDSQNHNDPSGDRVWLVRPNQVQAKKKSNWLS